MEGTEYVEEGEDIIVVMSWIQTSLPWYLTEDDAEDGKDYAEVACL